MRIVLDNNVFISGIFWHGSPHKIIELVEKSVVKLCVSDEILNELFGVLQRKKFDYLFAEAFTNRDTIFQKILSLVTVYPLPKRTIAVKTSLADPKDKMFIPCALIAKAKYIVSGDKHLLNLKEFRGIPILTANQFLNALRK